VGSGRKADARSRLQVPTAAQLLAETVHARETVRERQAQEGCDQKEIVPTELEGHETGLVIKL